MMDLHVFKVTLHEKDSSKDCILYATDRQALGSTDIANTFRNGVLVFMRTIRHGVFAISALGRGLKPVNIDAFGSQIALHERMSSLSRLRFGNRRRKKFKSNSNYKSQTSPPALSTAMSEAFKKARKT